MLKEEVRDVLRYIEKGDRFYLLENIEKNYEAYVVRENDWVGVGVPIANEEVIKKDYYKNFENIKICIEKKRTNDNEFYLLELLTTEEYAQKYEQFLYLCLEFIEPGKDGKRRDELINRTEEWVKRWENLLGNKLQQDKDYSFLGELIVLNLLIKKQINAKITKQGTYDIESEEENYEVKTTIMRHQSEIEIHSQYQLESIDGKLLKLFFVRLEESAFDGQSINSMLDELKNYEDIDYIKEKIKKEKISYEGLNKRYKVLDIRKYDVDDNFPRIIPSSFKLDKIPENIMKIKYTIDLGAIKYEKMI